MKGGCIAVLLAWATLAPLPKTVAGSRSSEKGQSASAAAAISKGIGCLVAQEWVRDDLQEIGVRVGQPTKVSYQNGSIPGTSPETPDVTNVLILSSDQKHGWLLFFRAKPDGTIWALRNAYRVQRMSGSWVAGEGNGGAATYKAIGAYAALLARRPGVRITLAPISKDCRAEE